MKARQRTKGRPKRSWEERCEGNSGERGRSTGQEAIEKSDPHL